MMKPSNIKEWERAKDVLYAVYNREYLADTWPARLGFAELIALQSDGDLNAWKTCILHAVYNGDIPVQDEQWFLGAVEPSEFWTGHKPKMALIPSCQKYQGDNVAFFSGELVTKYTVSPKDFAEYLKQQGEKPSKYILVWFCAYGVDIEPEPPLETDKTSDKTEPTELIRVLIPMQRAKTELLTLIYDFLSDYCKIKAGDKKPMDSKSAWGLLIDGKFTSSLISSVIGIRDTARIILNGGADIDYKDFAKTYDSRFKPVK